MDSTRYLNRYLVPLAKVAPRRAASGEIPALELRHFYPELTHTAPAPDLTKEERVLDG